MTVVHPQQTSRAVRITRLSDRYRVLVYAYDTYSALTWNSFAHASFSKRYSVGNCTSRNKIQEIIEFSLLWHNPHDTYYDQSDLVLFVNFGLVLEEQFHYIILSTGCGPYQRRVSTLYTRHSELDTEPVREPMLWGHIIFKKNRYVRVIPIFIWHIYFF